MTAAPCHKRYKNSYFCVYSPAKQRYHLSPLRTASYKVGIVRKRIVFNVAKRSRLRSWDYSQKCWASQCLIEGIRIYAKLLVEYSFALEKWLWFWVSEWLSEWARIETLHWDGGMLCALRFGVRASASTSVSSTKHSRRHHQNHICAESTTAKIWAAQFALSGLWTQNLTKRVRPQKRTMAWCVVFVYPHKYTVHAHTQNSVGKPAFMKEHCIVCECNGWNVYELYIV